jgi:hypothetical protein
MELLNGVVRGLTSLKEGQQVTLTEKLEVSTFAQLPSSVKTEGPLTIEIQVQSLGMEFIVSFQKLEVALKAPCNTCGHRLERSVGCASEYLAVPFKEVPTGTLDLKGHIRDILLSTIVDTLPCLDDPCEWREDVDRYIDRSLKQKSSAGFHPFQELLSEKKLKKLHQES